MGETKEQLVERRQKEIIVAAKRIFAHHGYRRTKLDQIAAELAIGKGTLYRYFEDKRSLFLAVFEEGFNRLYAQMQAKVRTVANPKLRIEAAIHNYLEFFDSDRELIEILMQVRSEFKDYYRQHFMQMYSEYIIRIQDTLTQGIEENIFRDDIDVQKTADVITDLLHGTLQGFYTKQQSGLLLDRAEAITVLLLSGLTKSTEADSADERKR